jgi:heme/copper-type cytochrome/quinol oxidase subunit 1
MTQGETRATRPRRPARIVRQTHRWVSIAFVITVVASTVVVAAGSEALVWVVYTPLLPLAALLVTGLYLFALPYTVRRRAARAR